MTVPGDPEQFQASERFKVHTILADQEELRPLLLRFVGNIPQYRERLHEAAFDPSDFKRVVHDIKGAFGNYGFMQVVAIAQDVEDKSSLSEPMILDFLHLFDQWFDSIERTYKLES